jgi:hypothetical protein
MDKLTRIPVAGIPEGFQELSFTTNGVTLNYVLGPDHGLPLLLIPGQMESWQGYKCVLPELSIGSLAQCLFSRLFSYESQHFFNNLKEDVSRETYEL